jgi:2,4-dienoyl-CoA reductase-like NADH-dependent reductase (Old Yellow Enzyme family)
MSHDEIPVGQSLKLPCGLKLSNRIVKAALEESLGRDDHQPNKYIYRLYERWAKGSFGLLLTGNVQIDERYPGLMTDLMMPNKDKVDICQSYGTPTIVQINHAGRQSPMGKRPFMQSTIAPSPIPMSIGDNILAKTVQRIFIGTPKEMTRAEIIAKAGFCRS